MVCLACEVFHEEDGSATEHSLLSTAYLDLHITIQVYYELSEGGRWKEKEREREGEGRIEKGLKGRGGGSRLCLISREHFIPPGSIMPGVLIRGWSVSEQNGLPTTDMLRQVANITCNNKTMLAT